MVRLAKIELGHTRNPTYSRRICGRLRCIRTNRTTPKKFHTRPKLLVVSHLGSSQEGPRWSLGAALFSWGAWVSSGTREDFVLNVLTINMSSRSPPSRTTACCPSTRSGGGWCTSCRPTAASPEHDVCRRTGDVWLPCDKASKISRLQSRATVPTPRLSLNAGRRTAMGSAIVKRLVNRYILRANDRHVEYVRPDPVTIFRLR